MKLSRGVFKDMQVRGTAPALITQSRTYRAGIKMRYSLFYYKKKKQKQKQKQPLLLHTLIMEVCILHGG